MEKRLLKRTTQLLVNRQVVREMRAEKKLHLPIFLIGFKTYAETTGKNALKLARIAKEVRRRTGVCIVPIPQFTDIAPIVREVGIPVFAQHIDPIKPGSFTGHILPEAVKEAGAVGTLINHSERKLPLGDIELVIKRAREVGLISCVCVDSPTAATAITPMKPDLLLLELPELIGTGRAISTVRPEIIEKTLESVRLLNPKAYMICGAGISKASDVAAAVDLGMVGIGVGTAIVKASDPSAVMLEMAQTLKSKWKFGRVPIPS